MQLTPRELYQLDIKERGWIEDSAQLKAVDALQTVYEQLLTPLPPPPGKSLFGFLKPKHEPKLRAGLYLWGGVGRGKTYLIDSFFSCLPFKEKRRVHFQRFMKEVHEILQGLPKSPNPLPIVARRFAQTAKLICLDEFHVDDVADAMLLAGLLEGLMAEGVVLVYTSNIEPDELYLNGLQRQRFLPAIELIKAHNQVVHLDSPTDYRLGSTFTEGRFHVPYDEQVDAIFREFVKRKSVEIQWQSALMINQRAVNTEAYGEGLIWLTFNELCATPKSYYDYLVIAEQYKTVMLSAVPRMNEGMDDVANRFIQLIDALYDHNNELLMSAEVALPELYVGQRLSFPFQRTRSRLNEMFSEKYLQQI